MLPREFARGMPLEYLTRLWLVLPRGALVVRWAARADDNTGRVRTRPEGAAAFMRSVRPPDTASPPDARSAGHIALEHCQRVGTVLPLGKRCEACGHCCRPHCNAPGRPKHLPASANLPGNAGSPREPVSPGR